MESLIISLIVCASLISFTNIKTTEESKNSNNDQDIIINIPDESGNQNEEQDIDEIRKKEFFETELKNVNLDIEIIEVEGNPSPGGYASETRYYYVDIANKMIYYVTNYYVYGVTDSPKEEGSHWKLKSSRKLEDYELDSLIKISKKPNEVTDNSRNYEDDEYEKRQDLQKRLEELQSMISENKNIDSVIKDNSNTKIDAIITAWKIEKEHNMFRGIQYVEDSLYKYYLLIDDYYVINSDNGKTKVKSVSNPEILPIVASFIF